MAKQSRTIERTRKTAAKAKNERGTERGRRDKRIRTRVGRQVSETARSRQNGYTEGSSMPYAVRSFWRQKSGGVKVRKMPTQAREKWALTER
jgi:hypothetical protein